MIARRPLIAGNWKMNGVAASATTLEEIIAGALVTNWQTYVVFRRSFPFDFAESQPTGLRRLKAREMQAGPERDGGPSAVSRSQDGTMLRPLRRRQIRKAK